MVAFSSDPLGRTSDSTELPFGEMEVRNPGNVERGGSEANPVPAGHARVAGDGAPHAWHARIGVGSSPRTASYAPGRARCDRDAAGLAGSVPCRVRPPS